MTSIHAKMHVAYLLARCNLHVLMVYLSLICALHEGWLIMHLQLTHMTEKCETGEF